MWLWVLWALLVGIAAATLINNRFWAARCEERWPMVTVATLIWFGATSGLALWVSHRLGGAWLWVSLTVGVQFAGLLVAGFVTLAGIFLELRSGTHPKRRMEKLIEEIVHLQLQRENLRQALKGRGLTGPERAFQMETLYLLARVMDDSGILNAIIEEIQIQLTALRLMLEHISSDPSEPFSMRQFRDQAEEVIRGRD